MGDLGALTGKVFEAVIFDLDGTLVDSTAAIERSWHAWMLEFGVDPLVAQRPHGVPAAQTVRELLRDPALHDTAVARIHDLECSDVEGVVALPGAREALRALSPAHTAIATSCTTRLARARMAAGSLAVPPVVVTADDVPRGKPAPDPFLEAARRLGVDPAGCLVVEDAPQGLTAARAARCATLAVVTTTARAELEADAVVADLSVVVFESTPHGALLRHRGGPA